MIEFIERMTNNQLISFLRVHTKKEFAECRVGTNPVTEKELDYARNLLRQRNRDAFRADQINRGA